MVIVIAKTYNVIDKPNFSGLSMVEQVLFEEVLQGNQAAISMIDGFAQVSQVWDDLIDQDKTVTPEAINSTFIILLSGIPRNSFYLQHAHELQPLIESAIIDWLTANKLETETKQELLNLSWVLRDNLAILLIGCAKIIGGMEWAIKVSPKIREFIHDEKLEAYKDGITRRRRHG